MRAGTKQPPDQKGGCEKACECRLLVAALPASLLEHFAVLVLAHLLAPLLDDATHGPPYGDCRLSDDSVEGRALAMRGLRKPDTAVIDSVVAEAF